MHSLVRHPNIVQIMGISLLKNSVYIISEFIDGKNLEDLVFGEDDESFLIKDCNKMNISRQLLQAVAYMHNLKPQVVHRDIKPANILVARETRVAKLCDMGLSKLKSNQSLSQTTYAIPGTPKYMAPECLLRKKGATAASDIWSVACTIVEMFTGTDIWEAELDEAANEDQIAGLTQVLSKGKLPRCLSETGDIGGLRAVIVKCFDFVEANRPSAINVLHEIP